MDLRRLAGLALEDQQTFLRRNERYAGYHGRLLCVVLCQGAAMHMIDGVSGIKDLDVWSFFAELAGLPLPPRRPRTIRDFGDPRLGKTADSPDFVGRRVDLFLRSIPAKFTSGPAGAVGSYLSEGRSKTSRELAKKAVVGLYPVSLEAVVIWPMTCFGRIVA